YGVEELWKFVGTAPQDPWMQIKNDGFSGVTLWAVDPTNPDRLYAAWTDGKGLESKIYRSRDGGMHWDEDAQLTAMLAGNGPFVKNAKAGSGPGSAYRFGNTYPQPNLLAFDPNSNGCVLLRGAPMPVSFSAKTVAQAGGC